MAANDPVLTSSGDGRNVQPFQACTGRSACSARRDPKGRHIPASSPPRGYLARHPGCNRTGGRCPRLSSYSAASGSPGCVTGPRRNHPRNSLQPPEAIRAGPSCNVPEPSFLRARSERRDDGEGQQTRHRAGPFRGDPAKPVEAEHDATHPRKDRSPGAQATNGVWRLQRFECPGRSSPDRRGRMRKTQPSGAWSAGPDQCARTSI